MLGVAVAHGNKLCPCIACKRMIGAKFEVKYGNEVAIS
jgi:hypothetical protein